MNIMHLKSARAPIVRASRPQTAPRLTSVWARDPETRRLQQTWRLADDADGSCIGRPGGPPELQDAWRPGRPPRLRRDGGGLRLAA